MEGLESVHGAKPEGGQVSTNPQSQHLSFAVLCASNMNRSMDAHCKLAQHGFNVSSYGTGRTVRLPGPTNNEPNVYNFEEKSYDEIYHELKAKNQPLYERNTVLPMLDRNRKIKLKPEKFQLNRDIFDVIITCEEKVFDAACEELLNRFGDLNIPVHVINVDIKDNAADAEVGGRDILNLCNMIQNSDDLDNEMDDILERFRAQTQSPVVHTIIFY